MTQNIIEILNARLLTTGYFRELYGLCELVKQEETSYSSIYTNKGERITVDNFDQINGLCYWRRISEITFTDIDASNNFSNNKLTRVSIPLRLIAVVNRELQTIDGPYNAEILGRSLFAVLNRNLNGNERKAIGARAIYLSMNSLDDSNEKITAIEFEGGPKQLNDKFVVCALSLTVSIEILASCIGTECDLLEACEALLLGLTTSQKNECILPSYNFADQNVLDNLTNQQETDLIEALCDGSCEGDINIYLDGTLLQTLTTTDYSTETINVTF